ncbi:hypothetical protein [Saccharicrinis fermentans]|nr:hypothetical protein [Saccharicrinis fermentans]
MEAINTVKPSKKFINKQYINGVLMTCVGLVGIAIGAPHLIGLGIFFLVMTSIQSNKEIIKVYEHHLETKFSALASANYIKFSDLKQVERVSDKKIFVHYMQGDKPKKFRVPVHMIDEKEVSHFLNILDSKIVAVAS